MDARLTELEILTRIGQQESLSVPPLTGEKRDLIAFLVWRGYVNDLNIPWEHGHAGHGLPGESILERQLHQSRIDTLSQILGGQPALLRITHAGRVRIAELTEAFRSSRIREPFGILWDGRHFDSDLKIRLLDASSSSLLAVIYMDLNGMKDVNDKYGHYAGDLVIRAYFTAVSTGLDDKADAYRLGGDEVGIVLSSTSRSDAVAMVRKVCLLLMSEHLRYNDLVLPRVSIAAGMVVTPNPSDSVLDLKNKADHEMYKAKEFTNDKPSRPSSLAIASENDVQEFHFEQPT